MTRGRLTVVPIRSKSDLVFGRVVSSISVFVAAALIYELAWALLMHLSPMSAIRSQIVAIFIGLEALIAGGWIVWTGKFEFSVSEPSTGQTPGA